MLNVVKPRKGTLYPESYPSKGQDLVITMVECCKEEDKGSMGARYIMNACKQAGFSVKYDHDGTIPSDLQLASVHHCSNWPQLADLPFSGSVRIAGGHVSTNNVRPGIPHADAWCIGEGEEWIKHAILRLSNNLEVEQLRDLPGTIISADWVNGSSIPTGNTVVPLPRHPPYLNPAEDGHAETWYIELSRGCPFQCKYCELGWAWKYRPHDTDFLISQLDKIDTTKSKRVTFFAPDEATHPGYKEILEEVHKRGLITSFGSMRFDSIVRKGDLPFKSNMLIRVAVDGLTQETRLKVSRRQTNEAIINYYRFMTENGHHNFKMFMIFGYPWESPSDFDEFEAMMDEMMAYPLTKNCHMRVKFTPLIPQPATPLGDCDPIYDYETVHRIKEWFKKVRRPMVEPGWFIKSDGIMSERNHAEQVRMTRGDETLLKPRTNYAVS